MHINIDFEPISLKMVHLSRMLKSQTYWHTGLQEKQRKFQNLWSIKYSELSTKRIGSIKHTGLCNLRMFLLSILYRVNFRPTQLSI